MSFTMTLTLLLFAVAGAVISSLAISLIQRLPISPMRDGMAQFHHIHPSEKSRLGGLAIAAALLVLTICSALFFTFDEAQGRTGRVVCICAGAMFLLGFWDDLKPLGARKKLLGQIAIAFSAWCGGIQIETFKNPYTGYIHQLGGYGCGVTVLWLIAMPNLINLIDGIDGLAGGVSLMLMGLLVYVGASSAGFFPALCAAGAMGAIIGFLRYNFPPAKIYLGDGGAYLLGFLVAELSIVNSNKGTIVAGLLAPMFVLALPILDVALAIGRRGLKGLPIFRPDRRHIHHKLLDIGYSPRRAVLTLYSVTLVFLVFALVVFWSKGRWAPVLFGVGCLAFILSARAFSFSREWFAVGRVWGNSMEMRESIHYALLLSRWFEMEAKNCDSVENLWSDFQLILLKLNFVRANLTLVDGRREWKKNDAMEPAATLVWNRREFTLGESFCLEFAIESDTPASSLFYHLSDIAAEAWHKAVARWCQRHGLPLRFSSCGYLNSPRRTNQTGRPYVPLVWGRSAALQNAAAGSEESAVLSTVHLIPETVRAKFS
jgi:UDP-GlcNAc:undecaprenyl-phosphate/decaprenyl-phosphate GlcNAc-1-phosphate transferase